MTPDDAVLAYDAARGWHLLPLLELGYGADLDAAVSHADHREQLCGHDRRFAATLRAGGWTDIAIAAQLGVLVAAIPAPHLLDQLHAAAGQVNA